MMNFLRKHQKKLFIVISVMVIASFSFFGTFSTMNTHEIPDKKIGQAVDGSAIMERELQAMIRFMSIGTNEALKNDLISTGLTTILAERYFGEIQDEFKERLERAKRWTPYAHPQVPFLSATQVWSRHSPKLAYDLGQVQDGELTPETFAKYSELYLDQVAFPPDLLRRVLLYQQQQFSWIPPDRELADERYLALFGYHSFEEWFGTRFTQLLGKFLFNAAAVSSERGHKVSIEEARADLLENCLHALLSMPGQKEANYGDARQFLQHQLQMLGLDETKAVNVWRKVLLARRLFNDVGQGVLVDPLSYKQFASFADETATVEVYQLPQLLRVRDFRSLLKLQYYFDAVSKEKNRLMPPRQLLPVAEVEKAHPELVFSRYVLEVAKASVDEISQRLTLKETWDYEASDEGWARLCAEYPVLKKREAPTKEERLKLLDEMDPSLRLKMDKTARFAVLEKHPEWIEEALALAPQQKQTVKIRSKGAIAPFEEIEETGALRTFLQSAPVGETVGEKTPLFKHDQTYYRITVLEKPASKEVMTLQEVQEGDYLGQLLDEKLQDAYVEVRKKESSQFKLEDGSWKPFAEVRDQVGALVFADHLKALSDKSIPLEQYPATRFARLMEEAKKSIQKEGESSPFLTAGLWSLVKETKDVKRSEMTTLPKTEMFSAVEGSWSSISKPSNGDLAFFRLIKKGVGSNLKPDQVVEGQRLLGMDARRLLMHQILDQVNLL